MSDISSDISMGLKLEVSMLGVGLEEVTQDEEEKGCDM